MIVVNMYGGLGGQMFQYALGRHLALKNNDTLELDITGFQGSGRRYELGNYNIKATPAPAWRRSDMKTSFLVSMFMTKAGHIEEQKPFEYDPDILCTKGDVYLDGYWADMRYFNDIADTIRRELSLIRPLGDTSQNCANLIGLPTHSVAVHFRRTDYPNEIGAGYYRNAVKDIRHSHPDATFFVFSDGDINPDDYGIPSERCINLSNSGNKPHEDMYLISKCKHHIISNSTFAWWGAWLGKLEGQMVFTPQNWFLDRPTPDTMCPKEWIRIDNSIAPRLPEKL